MKSLKIIFRCCAVVNNINEINQRPFELSKEEIILKSLKSLLDSCELVTNNITIDVIDDSSGDIFLEKLENILKQFSFEYDINSISEKNNGKSLEYCYNIAENCKEDLIYFCEDDYVHINNSIKFILNAYEYKIVGTDKFAIHPTDYPDRYININKSYIFLSDDCHWRSISGTTGTFFIPTDIFKKYKEYFYKFSNPKVQCEGYSINNVWKEVPLLSPIPSLAAHLNKNTLPKIIDWEKIIREVN